MKAGIPTTYKGIRFRSRLEARWAAFFDRIAWPWEYEPLDLDGYIPDFIITFPSPLLVEVKPALTLEECALAVPKIEASGWEHEAIVVGARLFNAENMPHEMSMGWMSEGSPADEYYSSPPPGDFRNGSWSTSTLGHCINGHIGISHDLLCYNCRVCGHNDGNPVSASNTEQDALRSIWAAAANVVQWRGAQS